MAEDIQVAQTGVEIKSLADTRCSICRGKRIAKREAINTALGKGLSWNEIESLTGVPSRTVGNHAQHLPAIFKEAKAKGILEQPIDVWKEFGEQLAFAKELRAAAAAWLRCPETGKITLEPRASEVNVIYLDPNDTTQSGEMKKKKANLQVMLDRIEGKLCESPVAVVSSDIRKFSFDALSAAETTIDKFAKMGGNYVKEVPPPPPVNVPTEIDYALFMLRKLVENMKITEAEALEQIKIHKPQIYGLLTEGKK